VLLLLPAAALEAQTDRSASARTGADGWNESRVLDLVRRGVETRQGVLEEGDLETYQAKAQGYVYFYVDREDRPEANLVKTDQIALEVYWRQPGLSRQVIVGLRDGKQLPTNIRYHIDHLTVVLDEFGDRIRMGDGDEVSSVVHPLAPGGEADYDYRLTDSLTITLPGPTEPVRVYGIQVRPRFPDQPAFVGTVYIDRATAAIVRMNFTFTPASYVDPYLDYIRISLDNGLWEGRYWLPYRQHVELRREIPGLDLPVGSVIRGRWEIGDYIFNPDIPRTFIQGRSVSSVPVAQREAYPFEEGLYAQVDEEGLQPAPSMEEIRRQAAEIVGDQLLTGVKPARLYLPSVSSTLRYSRAEGTFMGAGLSFQPRDWLRTGVHGGWAFARGKAALTGDLEWRAPSSVSGLEAYLNRLDDVGPIQGASGLYNSLAVLTGEQDFTDPWFRSGVAVSHRRTPAPGFSLEGRLWWEQQRSAPSQIGVEELPHVRPIEDQDQWGLSLRAVVDGRPGLRATVTGRTGFRGGLGFGRVDAHLEWDRNRLDRGTTARIDLRLGALTPAAPVQELALLGGRNSVPGFDYRSFVGDRYWLATGEVGWSLFHPWVRLRGLGSVGQSGLAYATLPEGWQDLSAMDLRGSLGVGLGLGWDVLRLDLHHGIGPGGTWQFVAMVDPRFWSWM
jgi:hypothetical protein